MEIILDENAFVLRRWANLGVPCAMTQNEDDYRGN